MIKVAGKFASPKEVEDCLMTHPAIDECAVVGRPDSSGLLKLFAFVTLKTFQEETTHVISQLSQHLESHLDRYKLPKRIVVLERFPKTHLGKINRGALSPGDYEST